MIFVNIILAFQRDMLYSGFRFENDTLTRRFYFMKEKVILAYSGGLDTTAIIPWLKENFDYEVICV